jgi:hypothetical protein
MTMRVLAIGHMTGKDFAPYLAAERAFMAERRREGLVESLFLKADQSGAVMLLTGVDAAEAERKLADLPFIVHGIATFEFIDLIDVPS